MLRPGITTGMLTSYIQSELAAGRTEVSFVLKNQQETQGRLLWNSKKPAATPLQLTIYNGQQRPAGNDCITIPAANSALNNFPQSIQRKQHDYIFIA